MSHVILQDDEGLIHQCMQCGSSNIEQKVIVFVPCNNNGNRESQITNAYYNSEGFTDDFWCPGCDGHITQDGIDTIGVADR